MLAKYDAVLDTSAWAAHFEDRPCADTIQGILIGEEVATSILTIAELADYYARNEELEPLWAEDLDFIKTASDVVPVSIEVACAAGATKTQRRRTNAKFGLLDALILETARAFGARLVTTDADFKGMPGVQWLPR